MCAVATAVFKSGNTKLIVKFPVVHTILYSFSSPTSLILSNVDTFRHKSFFAFLYEFWIVAFLLNFINSDCRVLILIQV